MAVALGSSGIGYYYGSCIAFRSDKAPYPLLHGQAGAGNENFGPPAVPGEVGLSLDVGILGNRKRYTGNKQRFQSVPGYVYSLPEAGHTHQYRPPMGLELL